MAMFHDLDSRQSDEVLHEAAQRRVPAIITVSADGGWRNFHSRMLAVQADRLCLELPVSEAGMDTHEFVPAEKIGVSFKLKHYKHVFTATVANTGSLQLAPSVEVSSLNLCLPRNMQRLQRRSFNRADVPSNRIVRATIWLGNSDAEPPGGSQDQPVWLGRVINISAGGLQMTTDPDTATALDIGDMVGMRLTFGAGAGQTAYVDAQYRHLETTQLGVLIGLQFIGMNQTPKGREAFEIIGAKVAEFQRAEHAPAGRGQD